MRGRTNVGGGGGISINAEVVDMIIHSGTITAGDFVEHYTVDDYIAQVDDINFAFEMNGCAIGTYGNMLVAYKNGQQIASYSAYNINCIGFYENFVLFHDNTQGILGVLTFANNTFTLIDTISTSISAECIGGGNGKIVTLYKNNLSTLVFGVANISSSGMLSNFQSSTGTVSTDGDHGLCAVFYHNGIFKVLYKRGGTGYNVSSRRYRYYLSSLAEITIDENNNVTLGSSLSTLGCNRILLQKSNVVILGGASPYDTGGNYGYTWYSGILTILNLETNGVATITLSDNGEALSYINDNGYFIATAKTSINDITWNRGIIANKLRLCKYNENEGSVTIEDEIVLPDDYNSYVTGRNEYTAFRDEINRNLAGIDANNIIYAQIKMTLIYIKNSSSSSQSIEMDQNIYLYNIVNGGLEMHPQEGYVIPYQSGHPIGVAKNNGSTGDTIGVYVPIPVE